MAEIVRPKGLTIDAPAGYRIRVQGYLDASWSERLGGVTITADCPFDQAPITTLTGEFIDQAALTGALGALCDLGMSLLLVECLGVADPGKKG